MTKAAGAVALSTGRYSVMVYNELKGTVIVKNWEGGDGGEILAKIVKVQ